MDKKKKRNTSTTYFKDLTNDPMLIGISSNQLKEQIQMVIQLTNCDPSSSYSLEVYERQNNIRNLLIKENPQNPQNGTITFNQVLILDYFFEIEQNLELIIAKSGYYPETITQNLTVGLVVGSRQGILNRQIKDHQEKLIITSKKLKNLTSFLKLNLQISNNYNNINFAVPENKVYYKIKSGLSDLYKSEQISPDGHFREVHIPIDLISPLFTFELYNPYNMKLLEIQKSPEDFCSLSGACNLINIMINNLPCQIINTSTIEKVYTLIDYLKNGVELGVTIGIDFTGSNGHPLDEGSLHMIKPGIMNDYEKVIYTCGNILAYYDYDQLFPTYGFGALTPGSSQPSMNFNLTLTQQSDIYTIEQVLQVYRNNIMKLTFSGPTFFSPIINKVIERAEKDKANVKNYQVLLILTDGILNDMEETIEAIVKASKLPISIIIVGIGNADFELMEFLDSDDAPLVSDLGEAAVRDIVQFVPFNKFEHDATKLAKQVLEELPRQVVEYYMGQNIYPQVVDEKPNEFSVIGQV